ncbi:MAG: flagellar FliJ family protein [Pseudomonadota bacterium]
MSSRVWQELIDKASRETTTARQHVLRHRSELERAEQQHRQLEMFREDYANQASAAGNRMSLSRMMHLRSFIENLDVAIAQLAAHIETVRARSAEAQQRLTDRRARQLALENLVAVREAREKTRSDRREQAAIDDLIQVHAQKSR